MDLLLVNLGKLGLWFPDSPSLPSSAAAVATNDILHSIWNREV